MGKMGNCREGARGRGLKGLHNMKKGTWKGADVCVNVWMGREREQRARKKGGGGSKAETA